MLGFRLGCGWCCGVGFLFGCCWFCVLLLCVSAWWNRGILDEVTKASYGRAVTGTAVMARSANEEKKKKMANSREAEARNLVALTRSKGLCVVLLPFTDKFPSCALHSLRTMCGYRQGIFTVGAASLDHQALGDFISQPDTSLEDVPSTFDDHSWKVAHQITYFGSWRLLPFVMGLTYGSTTYFFHLHSWPDPFRQ